MTQLTWDGCVNVRDLGGLPTEDGRLTRAGALVRADNIQSLTDEGWDALVAYGVRRVVDLRHRRELDTDAPRKRPVEIVHVSLMGDWDTETQAEYDARMDASPAAEPYLVWSYLDILARFRENVAAAATAVAEAPGDGGVVVHCLGGKDRTGLMSALALRVAGVEVPVVAADYALTEANLAARAHAWIGAAPDEAEGHRRRIMQPTPPSVMSTVLDSVESRHGSAAGYLIDAGATAETVERLRRRLLGAP